MNDLPTRDRIAPTLRPGMAVIYVDGAGNRLPAICTEQLEGRSVLAVFPDHGARWEVSLRAGEFHQWWVYSSHTDGNGRLPAP